MLVGNIWSRCRFRNKTASTHPWVGVGSTLLLCSFAALPPWCRPCISDLLTNRAFSPASTSSWICRHQASLNSHLAMMSRISVLDTYILLFLNSVKPHYIAPSPGKWLCCRLDQAGRSRGFRKRLPTRLLMVLPGMEMVGAPFLQRLHFGSCSSTEYTIGKFPLSGRFLDCQTFVCFTFVDIWSAIRNPPITWSETVVKILQLSSNSFATSTSSSLFSTFQKDINRKRLG